MVGRNNYGTDLCELLYRFCLKYPLDKQGVNVQRLKVKRLKERYQVKKIANFYMI